LEVGAGTVTPLPGVERPHNLPVALSSFVGRERELTELRRTNPKFLRHLRVD
jgi:hypothetical protein